MNFSKAIEGYKLTSLTEGYSPNTMEGYDWALKKIETFLSDQNIEEITPEDIRRLFFHFDLPPFQPIISFYLDQFLTGRSNQPKINSTTSATNDYQR